MICLSLKTLPPGWLSGHLLPMSFPPILVLGSIDAIRPVFLIVMGLFLMIVAWRLCHSSTGWTARVIAAGALLLGLGYGLIVPMYHAGLIRPYSPAAPHQGDVSIAMAFHAVKILTMNGGWLLFGIGIAMHAKLLGKPAPRRALAFVSPDCIPTHTSAPHVSLIRSRH